MTADFLTVAEVAERLRIEPQALHAMRRKGLGPPHIQVTKGATVIYPRDKLLDWERAHLTQ